MVRWRRSGRHGVIPGGYGPVPWSFSGQKPITVAGKPVPQSPQTHTPVPYATVCSLPNPFHTKTGSDMDHRREHMQPGRLRFRLGGRPSPPVAQHRKYTYIAYSTTFVELPGFTELVTELLSDDEYRMVQLELVQNPRKGSVIRGTGGARKLRVRVGQRGKRGGLRAIYYYQDTATRIWMLNLYEKSARKDLTARETRGLRQVIAAIEELPR